MTETETLKFIQKLDEEPVFHIIAETAIGPVTEEKRISITATDNLSNILRGMHQELIKLNIEVSKLKERIEESEKLVEDREIRMYTIQHALQDKDWVEADELFEIKTR